MLPYTFHTRHDNYLQAGEYSLQFTDRLLSSYYQVITILREYHTRLLAAKRWLNARFL